MANLSVHNLVKAFEGGVQALNNVSLEASDGDFLVLLGPSGCGKSTLLRCIAGLEEPTAGSIVINGGEMSGVAPKDRDVAMVFQNYALYPHMRVRDIMGFPLKMRKAPKGDIERRVMDAARMLGLQDLLDRKPRELSGGQRQRVALGRSLVRDPKLFLFDEPLSNLDAKLRVEIRGEIKQLHMRLQNTCVYVTHDHEEAMTLGSKIAVLEGGVLRQYGTPLEVYNQPANKFVAGFVGTPRMNFLNGCLTRADGHWYFEHGSGRFAVPSMPERFAGMPVIAGIRPQSVRFGAAHGVPATVRLVELLGDRSNVHLFTETEVTVIAQVDSQTSVMPGEKLFLHAVPQQLCLFDPGPEGLALSWKL